MKGVCGSLQLFSDSKLIDKIARQTGFLKRASKLTPQLFIDLMFYAVSKDFRSLRNISNEAQLEHSLEISKQGLDNRFSQASVDFSKELLNQALTNQFREVEPLIKIQMFKRILIKDSTRFDIDKSLKEYYPSYGGDSSPAGVSIQFEYDLKTNRICDLDLQSALDRDSGDALKKLKFIQKKDLIIRDLGYFHSDVLEYINKHEAYFITRLQATTKVYLSENCVKEIDFSEIYEQMEKVDVKSLDLDVYVGSKKRLPIRLIISLLPNDVYEKRIRTRNKQNKTTGYTTSRVYKDRAHFNLFLSNVPRTEIDFDGICKLYRVRWQVELIFKTWKSLIRISDLRKMRCTRLQTTLYMNLLWIIIHWEIIQPCRTYIYKKDGKLLSIFKSVDTMQEYAKIIRQSISQGKKELRKQIEVLFNLLSRNHWLEKRNNRDYFGDLILLFI